MKEFKTNNGTLLIAKECNNFYFTFAYSFEDINNKTFEPYTGSKKQFKAIAKEIANNNGMNLI